MNAQNAIVPVSRQTNLEVIQAAQAVAPLAQMYGLSPAQATIAMLTGYELGFGLVSSLNFIYVIKTKAGLKPTVSTQGMSALIQRAGILKEFTVTDNQDAQGAPESCTVKMVRHDGFGYEYTFTMKDAERAELLNKANWQHHPDAMLRARAISACARVTCPDVLAGLYLADELGAVTNADGEPIEGEVVETPKPLQNHIVNTSPAQHVQAPPPPIVEPPTTQAPTIKPPTFAELVEKYGPEAILAANDGRIPATDDELIAVERKLEAGIE